MGQVTARQQKNCKNWEYRFEGAPIDGKRKFYSKGGFKTKKLALEAGAQAYAEYNNSGNHFKPSEISFSDFLDEWFNLYCKVNLAATTQANYAKYIRLYIKPALGEYKLRAITASALQKLINDLFNSGMSRNTLTSVKGILTKSLTYAVEPLRYIQQSPAVYVKLPLPSAKPDNPQTSHPHSLLTKQQIVQIFERFPQGTTAYIPLLFGYKCGLRLGEAFAVTWQDIDFENATLNVNKQLQWSADKGVWYFAPPKYNSKRVIDIDTALVDVLKKTKEIQIENKSNYGEYYVTLYEKEHSREISSSGDKEVDFINVRDNGEFIQPRIMQHTSTVIQDELGITEFTFHSLRHTHASILLENRCDIKYVQERLGHKNIEVTLNIYQHLSEQMKAQNKKLLDRIFD